ncbi:MAG: thioredoxin family protein [Desulfosalsimonadaceae bacterium]
MAEKTLDNENGFDLLISGGICLACFNTPWSTPCRLQKAILDSLQERYGEQLTLVDVNIDYLEHLRSRFEVNSIPTMILFNRGKERRRMVGIYPETDLCRILDDELGDFNT